MDALSLTKKENIATVTIQSPPANALSSQILKDLATALDDVENDSTIKAVVIQGEGKFFSRSRY